MRLPIRQRTQAGVAAVEFALIVPIFLLILLGTIDYGWYFFVDLTTTNAAREGARAATLKFCSTTCPCATGSTAATTAVSTYMGNIGISSGITTTASCAVASGVLTWTIDVSVDFPKLTGYVAMPAGSTGSNTKAHAIAAMRGQ